MNKTEIKIGESHYKYCIYTLYKASVIETDITLFTQNEQDGNKNRRIAL